MHVLYTCLYVSCMLLAPRRFIITHSLALGFSQLFFNNKKLSVSIDHIITLMYCTYNGKKLEENMNRSFRRPPYNK